jgi:soluble lytic murein transglycosylase-like protein
LRDGKFINKLSSISKDLQIDPNLILRVMYGESGMNPKAKNPTG